jgi:hypothetical protein
MHVHNVYFWLKPDLDSQAVVAFEQGLAELAKDPEIKSGYFGRPAGTERDVVDNSYACGLVFVFEDRAAHDRYQVGVVHQQFIDAHLSKWARVVIYDIAS